MRERDKGKKKKSRAEFKTLKVRNSGTRKMLSRFLGLILVFLMSVTNLTMDLAGIRLDPKSGNWLVLSSLGFFKFSVGTNNLGLSNCCSSICFKNLKTTYYPLRSWPIVLKFHSCRIRYDGKTNRKTWITLSFHYVTEVSLWKSQPERDKQA